MAADPACHRPVYRERRLAAGQPRAFGGWLLQHVDWTEAEHAILAQGATAEAAVALGVAEGAPCLVVERRTWNGVQPVTFVRLWGLGGHSRLVGQFRQG